MTKDRSESGFDSEDLKKIIEEKEETIKNKEKDQGLTQKNPKASLAIASIVLGALAIGMIALFGGVGIINGEILGKAVLSAVTAGTAAFGAKKLYDLVGDKDKNQLIKLERMRKDHRRMEVDKRAGEAELALANLKKQAEDRRKVDMVMGKDWEGSGQGNFKKKGYISDENVKLTPDQNKLYEEMSKLDKANDDLKDITKKLSDTQTASLVNSIKILSTKLDKPSTDPKKIEDLKELLDAVVKKSDGSDLDAGGSSPTNSNSLKDVLRAGLGLGSDGNRIKQESSEFIDAQGRIKILKGLNEALEFDSAGYPKFGATAEDKKLQELSDLVLKEKNRTAKERNEKLTRSV